MLDGQASTRSTTASYGLPTPPRTPPRQVSSSQSTIQGSPSEWLYCRPKTPTTSRSAQATPALSSTMTLGTTQHPRKHAAEQYDKFESSSRDPKASGNAPFWSTMLRPRSRSLRSIPLLKSIPSQSQVDINESMPSLLPANTISISRRSPSVDSTSSSSATSATSSSHPSTPVSSVPSDPFVSSNKGYHRRHASQPSSHGSRYPPLSSPCPSKSILTRASSISTKESVAVANKSVKFVEIPTVHYASAGYWDAEGLDGLQDRDDRMDVDEMNIEGSSSRANWGPPVEYRDIEMEPPKDDKSSRKGLKRLISLSRRSSVSNHSSGPPPLVESPSPSTPSTPHSDRRKSSSSTISTATITPKATPRASHKVFHATPTGAPNTPPSTPPPHGRPTISGPYALGSHPVPASPAHSTTSLRSTQGRHRSKSTSNASAAAVPSSAGVHHHPLEAFRSSKNSAARSARSLTSVRSESSTATAPRLKSWLNRVGVGSGWS